MDTALFKLLDDGQPITALGFEFHMDPADTVERKKLSRYGGDETALHDELLHELQIGDCFIDIGAHYGYYTLPAAEKVGPQGKVFAVEADPRNASYLERSVAANGLENVKIVTLALSNSSGPAWLYQTGHRGEVSLRDLFGTRQRIKVQTRRASEVLPREQGCVLKLDVEGAEPLVLEGAQEWLKEFRPRCISVEVNTSALKAFGFQASDILDPLVELGYALYRVDEDKGTIAEEGPEEIMSFAENYYREINVVAREEEVGSAR